MRIVSLVIAVSLFARPALALASTPPPPIDVPEPTSMLLIGAGTLAGLGVAKFRKRRKDK